MKENVLRHLPSIDELLHRDTLQVLIAETGRERVRDCLRDLVDELRSEIVDSNGAFLTDPHHLTVEIESRLHSRLANRRQRHLQQVINATGVVLHTNLGRAPLSRAAISAIERVAGGYCNLEYNLVAGKRGKRGAGLEAMLCEMLGCDAAAVVNNGAAAVLITLNTLAEHGEVIISRGELIEIGGSFRIPDVIEKSGARIREVGTTNRTRLSDYEKAINDETRVIMRAHPSNFRIKGFTEKPSLSELAQLAHERDLLLYEDLGSGCLIDLRHLGIPDEPTASSSLKTGVSIVTFSGDKLLGGPQAGIILGDAESIKRIKRNPLMRALRIDKLTIAALEATILSYVADRATEEVPALAALSLTKEDLERRARAFIRHAKNVVKGFELKLIDGFSVVGGGSAPEVQLPAKLVSVTSGQMTPVEIEQKLRQNRPPVIARIVDDQLAIDLRTVSAEGEKELILALTRLRDGETPEIIERRGIS